MPSRRGVYDMPERKGGGGGSRTHTNLLSAGRCRRLRRAKLDSFGRRYRRCSSAIRKRSRWHNLICSWNMYVLHGHAVLLCVCNRQQSQQLHEHLTLYLTWVMDIIDRSLTQENHVWRGLQHGNAAGLVADVPFLGMQEAISAMVGEYKKHYRITKSFERNVDYVCGLTSVGALYVRELTVGSRI